MINPQLLNYVRVQRQAGVQKEDIIKALAGGGWSPQDAQEAFAAIEGVTVPPPLPRPTPPPSTPASSPQPVMAARPVMQQPIVQQAPVHLGQLSPHTQPVAVVQRQPVYAQVKKRRIWPWIFLLVIFLCGGFAGGAYMAVEYPVVEQIVKNVKSLIIPPTLEPVSDQTTKNTDGSSELFMPPAPFLEESATSTGSSTPN